MLNASGMGTPATRVAVLPSTGVPVTPDGHAQAPPVAEAPPVAGPPPVADLPPDPAPPVPPTPPTDGLDCSAPHAIAWRAQPIRRALRITRPSLSGARQHFRARGLEGTGNL